MTLLRALALTACAWIACAKGPLTHETMWLMKRVGPPVLSPDGKLVVFSVTDPAYDEKDQSSDLWIVPAEGGTPPRRLTSTKAPEAGVAWSPDSRRIAFSARREGDEASQIYVLDLAGGEAVRFTSIASGATRPLWRPDGKAILFGSLVQPPGHQARKSTARVYDSFPIRYWDHWLDERKPHLFVQEIDGKPQDVLAGSKLAASAGFAGTQSDTSEELRGVWAPDGQSIVFSAASNRNQAAYAFTTTHLFHVPAQGGEPRQITSGDDSYSNPAFAPNGKALYSTHHRGKTGFVYTLSKVARFPWPGPGERSIVTARFDRAISSFDISPDSNTLYLLAEDSGQEKLYTLPATGGEARAALDQPLGVYTGLQVGGSSSPVLVANWESAVNPAELVRIDSSSRSHHALTSFNDAKAASIDWQPLRHFTFTSKRGKKIHNLLVLPPGFDQSKKYPLFTLIHGGANNMWRDQFFLRWNYHLLASPGYALLLTNYTGSTGFGEKFAQEIQGDPLAGPGEEINEAVDAAIKQFSFIDGTRLAAGGASYGGHLTNWLEATTTRYKCLVSHAGLINLESQWGASDTIYSREITNGGPVWEQGPIWKEQNPIRRAKNFKTPILLTIGERDFRVPLNQTLEHWSVLKRLQVPSKLIVFPDANHWITKGEDSRFFYTQVFDWLNKWL